MVSIAEIVGLNTPAPVESGYARQVEASVPRLTLDVFCASPDFASVVREALDDRRMSRVVSNLAMGGVEAVAKRYEIRPEPNLLIFETSKTGFEMFPEMERLASLLSGEALVVLVGDSNDVSLYRELIREGVADYLVKPCAPIQLIDAVGGLFTEPDAAPSAKVISVFGAKGGVGASVLAHNLAWLIAEDAEAATILMDLDLEFGSAGLGFNAEVKHGVSDALLDSDALDDVKLARLLYTQSEKLKILPSRASVRDEAVLDAKGAMALIDIARKACDVVVLDVPHAWGDGVRVALRQSDEVVLAITPELTALRNAKAVMEWLSMERRNDAPPRIALLQTGAPKRLEIPRRELAEALGAEIDFEAAYDGALFAKSVNNGQMIAELKPDAPFVEDAKAFCRQLLGRPQPTVARRRSLIAPLDLQALGLGALAKALGGKSGDAGRAKTDA
ncbi:MAG: AAA family ATPase [Rhodobacteraceae bacterium]|nr:AAA family ATPase [Paracoccaceae bacterium]